MYVLTNLQLFYYELTTISFFHNFFTNYREINEIKMVTNFFNKMKIFLQCYLYNYSDKITIDNELENKK